MAKAVRVQIPLLPFLFNTWRADSSARRERLPYKQEATGSNPVPPRALLLAGLAAILAGCGAGSVGTVPAGKIEAAGTGVSMAKVATIKTERGDFRFVLFEEQAPKTVANFVSLVQSGFYRNLLFHRVVAGVLIQTGDPTATGRGGPGYTIKAEFNDHPHLVGTVGMARTADPDSAGSQFFICRKELPHLDGKYTVFGRVFQGQDVVDAIRLRDRIIDITLEQVSRESLPSGVWQ